MNEQIKTEIEAMKKWCMENYNNGADTMAECWDDSNYAELFVSYDGTPCTTEEAWETLKRLALIYQDRQADAENSAF